jgi:4-hydroxy-tetrahydrodipicolinate reductase
VKKIKLGLIGSTGRMGLELKKLIDNRKFELAYEADSKNFDKLLKSKNKLNVDIWIDFSTPDVLEKFLVYLQKNPQPLVSGTTGISSQTEKSLKKLSIKTAVFWAPNMSIGVALVAKALDVFKGHNNFDFQIDETHHKHKKDSPSGTALFLQKKLNQVLGHKKTPQPLATRGGGVYGIHRIQALSDEEIVSIEHTALNRSVFAKGALWAAQQIVKKKSGYFEMKDLI